MAAKDENNVYHRRLDRTPDKMDFFKLPEGDRRLVGQLRSAMEGVHSKVTSLRDEVEEKERDINREQTLRKAAESRLDQLVDMYGDPSVNEELRDRLPRARKEDVRQEWQTELNAMNGKQSGSKSVSFDDPDNESTPVKKHGKNRSKSADSRRRRGHHEGSDVSDYESEDEGYNRGHRNSHHYSYPPGYPPYAMPYPMPPPPQYHPAYYPSPSFPPVQGQSQMLYPQSVPGNTVLSPGATLPVAQSTPIHGVQGANINNAVTPANNTGIQTQGGGVSSLVDSVILSGQQSSQAARDAVTSREQTRQITLLLAELDAAKELNKNLEMRVDAADKELEAMKISQNTQQLEMDKQVSGRLAEMVEEIYAAQKQRDEAMMNRLRIANEERDEALLKLRHLETSLDQLNDNAELPLDLNIGELLKSLSTASTTQDITDIGRHLVNEINNSVRRQKQVTTEEMRLVLEERDNAMAKYKELEAEVLRQQRINRAKEADKNVHTTTQAKLLATQQERDMALSRCQKLEEEMQTLQVYYSLHKSLSQEANLRDQYNNSLDHIEGALHQRESMVEIQQKENNRLAAQFQSVVSEKNQLAEDLNKSQFAQKEALANQEKLERLVNVLRRKINGLGTKTEE